MIVLGSANMDITIRATRAPRPGETVLGDAYALFPGGKGANQAVAAQRAGSNVVFVGCIGLDAYGDLLVDALASENIDLSTLKRVNGNTGVAFITVEDTGENHIVVIPGANHAFRSVDLSKKSQMERLLLIQLEIPVEAVLTASAQFRATGGMVILNASPISAMPIADRKALLDVTDILIVNETEASMILEESSVRNPKLPIAAVRHLARNRYAAVITCGSSGVVWSDGSSVGNLPSHPVAVVDTTGCGDAFAGAFASAMEQGKSLEAAVAFGNAAGALAAMKLGAQPSLPDLAAINAFIEESGSLAGSMSSAKSTFAQNSDVTREAPNWQT
jgi:ribokinase